MHSLSLSHPEALQIVASLDAVAADDAQANEFGDEIGPSVTLGYRIRSAEKSFRMQETFAVGLTQEDVEFLSKLRAVIEDEALDAVRMKLTQMTASA